MPASFATKLKTFIQANLFTDFAHSVSEQFQINETEFQSFFDEYLESGLKSSKKKGKGKGKISAYIAFSMEERTKLKDKYKSNEILPEIGKRWKALSDKQKQTWKVKADKRNAENGLAPASDALPKGKTPMVVEKQGGRFLVKGTSFVVKSMKNKKIVGTFRHGETTPLDDADLKLCKKNGWAVMPPEAEEPETEEDVEEPETEDEADAEEEAEEAEEQ